MHPWLTGLFLMLPTPICQAEEARPTALRQEFKDVQGQWKVKSCQSDHIFSDRDGILLFKAIEESGTVRIEANRLVLRKNVSISLSESGKPDPKMGKGSDIYLMRFGGKELPVRWDWEAKTRSLSLRYPANACSRSGIHIFLARVDR